MDQHLELSRPGKWVDAFFANQQCKQASMLCPEDLAGLILWSFSLEWEYCRGVREGCLFIVISKGFLQIANSAPRDIWQEHRPPHLGLSFGGLRPFKRVPKRLVRTLWVGFSSILLLTVVSLAHSDDRCLSLSLPHPLKALPYLEHRESLSRYLKGEARHWTYEP